MLLVQAGAAASGLTLTSACKMFLMEPFLRYEEEQQAYARCHRYGQTKPVHCKCYFAPVSVESRLLEWRRRAKGTSTLQEPSVVYAENLDCDSDEEGACMLEGDGTEGDEETTQTNFLLGVSAGSESDEDDAVEMR